MLAMSRLPSISFDLMRFHSSTLVGVASRVMPDVPKSPSNNPISFAIHRNRLAKYDDRFDISSRGRKHIFAFLLERDVTNLRRRERWDHSGVLRKRWYQSRTIITKPVPALTCMCLIFRLACDSTAARSPKYQDIIHQLHVLLRCGAQSDGMNELRFMISET